MNKKISLINYYEKEKIKTKQKEVIESMKLLLKKYDISVIAKYLFEAPVLTMVYSISPSKVKVFPVASKPIVFNS
jgi:hypothetical protein